MNALLDVPTDTETAPAQDVLQWALDQFHPEISLACSFSAEDLVVLDMMSRVVDEPRVFMLDTGRLPQATYDLADQVRRRYGIEIAVYFPNHESVQSMVREHGLNPFYRSVELRKRCCHVRKVEPLGRALSEVDGWITGLRRDQNPTRAETPKVDVDEAHGGIYKISPIADWTSEDVWTYVHEHSVPYNALYDQGYASIGCAPCTRPIQPGEPERAGRWWWEDPELKECGLHVAGQSANQA
ncbi:MAG: phosphoadenylyl-sulfate reductase [Salinibacter sp.]